MKISTDDIQGQVVQTTTVETREVNNYLEKIAIERCVMHAQQEITNSISEYCIVLVLYGKGIITVDNKVIGVKANDLVMFKNKKEFTILNTNNEDLAYLIIC